MATGPMMAQLTMKCLREWRQINAIIGCRLEFIVYSHSDVFAISLKLALYSAFINTRRLRSRQLQMPGSNEALPRVACRAIDCDVTQ